MSSKTAQFCEQHCHRLFALPSRTAKYARVISKSRFRALHQNCAVLNLLFFNVVKPLFSKQKRQNRNDYSKQSGVNHKRKKTVFFDYFQKEFDCKKPRKKRQNYADDDAIPRARQFESALCQVKYFNDCRTQNDGY